jgi:hypothetical protein
MLKKIPSVGPMMHELCLTKIIPLKLLLNEYNGMHLINWGACTCKKNGCSERALHQGLHPATTPRGRASPATPIDGASFTRCPPVAARERREEEEIIDNVISFS